MLCSTRSLESHLLADVNHFEPTIVALVHCQRGTFGLQQVSQALAILRAPEGRDMLSPPVGRDQKKSLENEYFTFLTSRLERPFVTVVCFYDTQ